MASGHVNLIERPNTWLHRPMLQNVKKALANPEPSTHDPERTWRAIWIQMKKAPALRGAFILGVSFFGPFFRMLT